MSSKSPSIIWLRRNLRLEDNLVITSALKHSGPLQFIFIFDSDILSQFPDPNDRRLSFIAAALEEINQKLRTFGGNLLIFHGRPAQIIPKLATDLGTSDIFADEDFEPYSIKRDDEVKANLQNAALHLICDHLLLHPSTTVKSDGMAFKVFTPFMRSFRALVEQYHFSENKYNLEGKIARNTDVTNIRIHLEKIGYNYREDKLWPVKNAKERLDNFVRYQAYSYSTTRDFIDQDGTSAISPYLRFGIISIRECYRKGWESVAWINELIWREFYASILYHFPETTNREFQSKYINFPWKNDEILMEKFTSAKTGFPIIDAAIKQLITDGWMHNRARMIVASFFTKNLLLDWRLGEKFFAKYLMDYDLSSNVGGWQWAASCGTDAQPYFRIFNPTLQSAKFDPEGKFIKKYLPELTSVNSKDIHHGDKIAANYHSNYPKAMIDYSLSRATTLEAFKKWNG